MVSVISGNAAITARISWATPTVATSSITRGRLNRRRTTVSSTSAPANVPISKAAARPIQKGKPQSICISANKPAAGSPRFPTAKLITRVER